MVYLFYFFWNELISTTQHSSTKTMRCDVVLTQQCLWPFVLARKGDDWWTTLHRNSHGGEVKWKQHFVCFFNSMESSSNYIAKGQELAKKAENKVHGCCFLFGSNFEDAAQLFHNSATSFKLAKSCISHSFV